MARRTWKLLTGFGLGAALGAACSAGGSGGGGGVAAYAGSAGSAGSGATGGGGGGGGGTSGVGGLVDSGPQDSPLTSDAACAKFTAQAENAAAAMLIVLDRSSSMVTANKWLAAQTAIPQAIDDDEFDNTVLGLLAYPAVAQVAAPQCLALLVPTVSCGVPGIVNVPLQDTGTDKSTAGSGVRREIADWLLNNGPDADPADASPGYEAMKKGIEVLQGLDQFTGRRIMLFVSDGGFSCAAMANGGGSCFGQSCGTESPPSPRPGYCDGACWDWEYPATTVQLLYSASSDAQKPVSTFIVGVPGSNTTGTVAPACQMQGPYAYAPYSMRLALSAYAYAGSPTTVPSSCDGTSFNFGGSDPSTPCHYDMTAAGFFDAASFAQVISDIRGAALACTWALPEPPPGETIDPDKVNVVITVDGQEISLKKRSDPTDPCDTGDGCWDYDADGQVVLVGAACEEVSAASAGKVDILVGCATLVK